MSKYKHIVTSKGKLRSTKEALNFPHCFYCWDWFNRHIMPENELNLGELMRRIKRFEEGGLK